jgi:hypothetical protein
VTKLSNLKPRLGSMPARIGVVQPKAEAERSRFRDATQPWRAWYKTARWRQIRAAQLREHRLCRMCMEAGQITQATVCDHRMPHRGDEARFWAGPFDSLCKAHHDSTKQAEEAAMPKGVWY